MLNHNFYFLSLFISKKSKSTKSNHHNEGTPALQHRKR